MSNLSGLLALNEDVVLVPVADLPPESRAQIDCDTADFAVSRLQSRSGSKIIDAKAASLLGLFREPRTVAEVVILFGREKRVDPEDVLEGAYPMLRSMLAEGILVPVGGDGDMQPEGTRWVAGDYLVSGTVVRTLQVLDDTEVYLLRRPDGQWSVLKLERSLAPGFPGESVRVRLYHEAQFLMHLEGRLAPQLLGQGEVEKRAYVEMEFLHGVDAFTAAAGCRERDGTNESLELHALVGAIVHAYAKLHERDVLHGDVHPRNVIICRDASVRLIDFGLARCLTPGTSLPSVVDRGGMPFFFEPELAHAYLAGSSPPATTSAGEQYAVAALIYFLVTGAHWQDFRLAREQMLEDIAERRPLSFSERGATPWPELETVLVRALSKDPSERYPSMASFAGALSDIPARSLTRRPRPSTSPLTGMLSKVIDSARIDGPWLDRGLAPAPTCSLTYGSAGVALGILQIAGALGDARLLAAADVWANRAAHQMGSEDAFYNPEIQITRELVGEASPYHSPSGVYAVTALVSRAMANPMAQAEAVAKFLDAARRPVAGLDVTLGQCSTLLGAAILLDALSGTEDPGVNPLHSFGDTALGELWRALDAKPTVTAADIQYPGIAHGWAGFIYATLQWCRVTGSPIPSGVDRRLAELGALAFPSGRGLEWPWVLRSQGDPPTMTGWCNGSCGYVFLWTLAHFMLGIPHHLDLAVSAAWNSWESPDTGATLCCGLAGRAYALLNLYRHTRETVWLDRARDLGLRAAKDRMVPSEYPHSLYKGGLGVAVLGADLEQPEKAVMPFFEPMGYRV